MALEVGTRINDLTITNPTSSDPAGQGDDHLRLIKACVQGSLPNIGGILGQARQLDVATSLSSVWNTQHIFCTSSATATVVLTLPPAASITSGFYFDITTLNGASVSLLPSGAGVINGAASLSIPERSTCHVFFIGGTGWRANVMPSGLGGIYVADNLQVRGTLSVSGAAHLNTTLSVGGAATLASTLSVSGATTLKGLLSVSGAATLGGTLSVSGNATLLGGLDVKGGTSSFSTAVYMGATLTVSGAAVLLGSTTLGGTLSVSGAAHLNSTVSVGGAATLASTLSVSGAAHFNTTVSVGGAASLASTLSVSGAAHFNTTVSVDGAATLGGTLTVSGATTLLAGLSVSGATVLASTLAVRGAATMDTTLSVSGAATFKSAASFAASVVIGTTLNVAGATTLSGAATLKGTVSIGGATQLGSTLSVSGSVMFASSLTISGTTVMKSIMQHDGGQISWPSTQVPSAGANVMDDYEEGTWTPTITFQTPGNLSVTYGTQAGNYTKIGNLVSASYRLTTATFTHTTASGAVIIAGLPFTPNASPTVISYGLGFCTGIVVGSEGALSGVVNASSTNQNLVITQSTGGTSTTLSTAHFPTGATKDINGCFHFYTT